MLLRTPAQAAQPQRMPLFGGLLGWVVGVAFQIQQSALWEAWLYALLCAGALLVLLAWRWLRHGALRLLLCVAAFALVGFCSTGLRSLAFASGSLNPALEGRDVLVTGVVVDLPQRTESGLRFRLDVSDATLDGAAIAVPGRIDVGWYGGVYALGNELVGLQRQPQDLKAGERWRMLLRLKAPHGSSNPQGFDYELWLWEQGVQATGYVRAGPGDPEPQRLVQTWQHPVDWLRQRVRDRIFSKVEPAQAAGLVAALVVGDQRAIDRVDWDVFRATGVAHLVSISGLHITMFAWGASLVVGWLWRRSGRLCLAVPAPSAALLGGVLLALAYSVFSGWGLPAQRTCLMLATVSVLRLQGVRWPWPQVWMLACAVVVACDPWALLQAGFWLSFVAVGVLFATDPSVAPAQPRTESADALAPAHATLPAREAGVGLGVGVAVAVAVAVLVREPVRRIRTALAGMVREQWTITLALAPLTLMLFGQVSVVGMVANLFAIAWVTLVITPLAMLGVVVPAAWTPAAGAIAVLMDVLQWLAAWPMATLSLAAAPLWAGMLGVLGGVVLVARLPWHLRTLGVPLMLPVLMWQAPLPAAGQFDLLAPDIGQGNAVLVRTANHALLYDAGPRYSLESDAGHRVLVPLLQALQTRLDLLILSHRDTDHAGGAAAVLTMQPLAHLLSSVGADHPLQALRAGQRCEAGQRWEWDGVRFDILHPQATDYAADPKPNALSCVLKVSNGQHAALLVGDIEAPQEQALLERGTDLRADVLLAPHHGSKTSSSPAFLDAVQPGIAVVQSGYRNRYGHPAPWVMQRYQDRNIVVRDSPHCGAMTWGSSDPGLIFCTRMMRHRYWHHQVP